MRSAEHLFTFRAGLSCSTPPHWSPGQGSGHFLFHKMNNPRTILLKTYRPGRPTPDSSKCHGVDPWSQFVWDQKFSQDVGLSMPKPEESLANWADLDTIYMWKWSKSLKSQLFNMAESCNLIKYFYQDKISCNSTVPYPPSCQSKNVSSFMCYGQACEYTSLIATWTA